MQRRGTLGRSAAARMGLVDLIDDGDDVDVSLAQWSCLWRKTILDVLFVSAAVR